MSSLKKQSSKTKISKNSSDKKGGDCEQQPKFSFQHLTSNKKYNFAYFNSNQRKKRQEIKEALYDILEAISQQSWQHWSTLSKYAGYEILPFHAINFSPQGIDLSKDDNIIIFRFSSENFDGRILGFRKEHCPIYYIIGYDFDHSSYKH